MYSNTIQARIEATLKDLYKVHDTVFKPAVMYAMYSNIRAYFIILDKDNKAQLLNAFDPRVVEHEDKLELDDSFYVLPCGCGTTGAIKKFQELMGIYIPPETLARLNNQKPDTMPLVLVGPYEHHSNELSFREGLCEVIRIPLDNTGHVDLQFIENILKLNESREIIISMSAASNLNGLKTNYKAIYKMTKDG